MHLFTVKEEKLNSVVYGVEMLHSNEWALSSSFFFLSVLDYHPCKTYMTIKKRVSRELRIYYFSHSLCIVSISDSIKII